MKEKLRLVVSVNTNLKLGPKVPSYLPCEAALAAELNARIAAGDTSAYAKLTKLAVRAVRNGRLHREEPGALN